MVRKHCVSAVGGALIFLLIYVLVAALLPTISLAKPVSTEAHFQAIIPAITDPTANLPSVADADVRDRLEYRDTNYGTSTHMRVGYDLDTGTYKSFVRFDVSSIPSGATINSASFNAYVDGVGGSPTIGLYPVHSPWGEGSVTWNNQPDVDEFATIAKVLSHDDRGKWVSWDVTWLVGVWVARSDNYGLCLQGPEDGWAEFYTRETANAPYLLIDYTSEAPPVDNTPPELSISHSPENPTSEDQVTFTATASDPGGIDRIEILVNARLVKTCTSSPCTYIGGPFPEGTVTYGANAYDKAGNRAWTGYLSFAVGPAPDTTPPQVSITYSPESPTTEDMVTFTATASDPGGIDRIEIWVNARLVKTCTSSPCIYTGGPYPERAVTYGANAYDKAGNIAWTGYKGFTVVEVELPDLVVTEIECDWENHRIGYKIRNIGEGVAPACHDAILEVELEEDRWEGMDRDHVDVDLEPETSYEGWFEIYPLPACKTMAVRVGADARNSIDESNEDNNWLEGECICEEELPDLEITDVWNTDSQICYRIRNIGEATADTPVNALYIDDEWVAEDCLPEPLEPGEQVEQRCFDYHWQLTDAHDLVEVCADWQEDIYEGDEDNNCLSLVIAPPLPDLVVSIVGPETAIPGEDIDIEATVRNIGWVLAPGRINEDGTLNPDGYLVDVILSSDRNIPIQYRGEATGLEEFAEDMLLNTLSQTISILPGEEATYTLSTHIPGNTPARTYCLGAVVDPGRVVDEYREANNTYCHLVGLCPTVEFNFSEGGRQVETSIPIFGEPDTDGDGVNDCWENAAMEALEPLLELDEEEDWVEKYQTEHHVAIFARVWPYTNNAGATYIIFYYMVTWSKDYGRLLFGVSEHAGDTEKVITAWKVLNDNTIRMEWVFTGAHGLENCDAHSAVWSPWEETCNVGYVCPYWEEEEFCAELEFSEATESQPPRLLIQVSEDKHAMYPTCEVCEEVALVDVPDYLLDNSYLDEIPVIGSKLCWLLQQAEWIWDNTGAPVLVFLSDVVKYIGGVIASAFSTVWDWMTGWDDDPLGKEVVMLTYDHLRDGVSPLLNFKNGDYHYTLSWHIENENDHFPSVRVIIDDLFCVDETDPERVWAFGWRNWVHDKPYLIITGFSTYPSIDVWPVGEPYFTGFDDDESQEVNLVVFDGEVTTNSLIGFNVLLFEDDGSDTDSGDRQQIGEGMCDEIDNGFLGVAEVVECEETEQRSFFTFKFCEDCSGEGPYLFPVYNIGEPQPQNLWITNLAPYGFDKEYIEGRRDSEGRLKFCGGLESCGNNAVGCIYDSIKEMPSLLKEKLD